MAALQAQLDSLNRQRAVYAALKGERRQITIMFADISGFTPLTASLAHELGPQHGAEDLTLLLNRVYGALIDQVHNYRGSVIAFSGDGINCWSRLSGVGHDNYA